MRLSSEQRQTADLSNVGFGLFSPSSRSHQDGRSRGDEGNAIVSENLRALIEQAAAFSGAVDDALTSRRIADQEEKLEFLEAQRDQITQNVHNGTLAARDWPQSKES